MKHWQHIAVSVICMGLSQVAYYYAALSNAVPCDACQPCVNPYYGLFDLYKSGLQLFFALVWFGLAFINEFRLGATVALFWVLSVTNEFVDYLYLEHDKFKLDEYLNLPVVVLLSTIFYLLWRKKPTRP